MDDRVFAAERVRAPRKDNSNRAEQMALSEVPAAFGIRGGTTMFGTNLVARRSKPEQIADQAWEHLLATVNSAGESVRGAARDTARSARRSTSHLAGGASNRVNSVADEAWRRATAASAALAGRRPGLPWLWIIGAVGVGATIGWAAGSSARALIAREGTDPGTTEGVEFVELAPPIASVRLNN
jgi:hypothetical protein